MTEFDDALASLVAAETLLARVKNEDPKHADIWAQAETGLKAMRGFIEKKQVPTVEEKQKISFDIMLGKVFDTPEASKPLAPLFAINNKFDHLGLQPAAKHDVSNFLRKMGRTS
jgi:hypothetical protein